MKSLSELYERLGTLCRRQLECAAAEDLDGLERLLADKDALLSLIAQARPSEQDSLDRAECERATAAALAASALEEEAERVLKQRAAGVRELLCRTGDGRAALRSYRPAAGSPSAVDHYS